MYGLRACLSAAVLTCLAAAGFADDLPEPVAAALAASAETDSREDWRFRITVATNEGEMQGRFDGSAAEGEQWVLVYPAQDELDGTLLEIWDDVRTIDEEEEDEGGLFFQSDDFDYVPGSVSALAEEADALRFAFAPQMEEGEAAAFSEFVRGEVDLGSQGEHVEQIRIFATESFKPNVAVRINAFEMVQEFVSIDGLPAPVMSRFSQTISGSAAFQRFEQNVDIRFDEVEYLAD